ncbi:ABC transporter substrate-binding protein [Agarivorans aestuarii]|uniref:ABC transporter substrate-binding protein n=1 Tax=Agarivorans aestuarii TaxID=1563703 RepID=UPI001C7F8924|nr:ABC transporter substrate-binding protein [Agarivorans aestuarii]
MKTAKTLAASLVSAAILSSFTTASFAADVPAGVKLAPVQELVRGNGTEPASLDPHKTEGVPESNVIRELLEGLVNQDGDGNLVPGVAESWETEDNLTFVFHLRKDAKWSNGDALTAHDFEYSFKRAVDPKTAAPYSWYLEMTTMVNAADIINGKKDASELAVKALDDYTLEIKLEQALPYFVAMTSHTTLKPVHKATVEKFGDKWTLPANFVGNGAYKVAEWVVNEKIVMERNENYWDNDKTVINKVTYLPIENQVTDMNRFLAGEIDMTYEMANEHFKRMQKEQPDSLKVTPYLCSYYYGFNNKKAPFDDVRVRKALSYAIDRDAVAKFIVGKGELPAYNFAHQKVAGLQVDTPDYATWSQKERNAKAAELLAEVGYGKDKPLEFTLLYNTSENHKKIAIAVASMWKKTLGVKVNLENQEWKTFLDNRRNGNYDVTRAGWCGDYNEASTFLSLMQSNNGNNDQFYNSPAYDGFMNAAMTAVDDAVRGDNYRQAEAQLAQDMPLAPIYHYVNARLVKPTVGGYPMNNAEDKIYTKDLYIIAK